MDFLAAVAREASIVPTEFHESGVWTPAGGGSKQVAGIFSQVSEVTDIGAYIEADGVSATYNMASADIAPTLGDALTVRGYNYRIVGIEPTGRGRTVLVLGLIITPPPPPPLTRAAANLLGYWDIDRTMTPNDLGDFQSLVKYSPASAGVAGDGDGGEATTFGELHRMPPKLQPNTLLSIYMWCEDWDLAAGAIQVFVGETSSYLTYSLIQESARRGVSGWQALGLNTYDGVMTGGTADFPVTAGIGSVRVRMTESGPPVLSYWLDSNWAGQNNGNGQLLLTYDDNHPSHPNIVKTQLNARGLRGTFGVFSVSDDTAIWKEMVAEGHLLVPHGTVPYTSLPTEQSIIDEINGIVSAASALGVFVDKRYNILPNGLYDRKVLNALTTLNTRLSRQVGQQKLTALPQYTDPFDVFGRLTLPQFGWDTNNGSSMPVVEAFIDRIRSEGGLGTLMFHEVAPAPSSNLGISDTDHAAILDYAQASGVDIVTMDGLWSQMVDWVTPA